MMAERFDAQAMVADFEDPVVREMVRVFLEGYNRIWFET